MFLRKLGLIFCWLGDKIFCFKKQYCIMDPKKARKNQRKIDYPRDTLTEFELEEIAADIQGRTEEKKEKRKEAERVQRKSGKDSGHRGRRDRRRKMTGHKGKRGTRKKPSPERSEGKV